MRELAESRGPVDGRPDIVVLVTQLHLAGMHPDPQSQRHQRRPLQRKRAGHRIGGSAERDDEAVAFALLDPNRVPACLQEERVGTTT